MNLRLLFRCGLIVTLPLAAGLVADVDAARQAPSFAYWSHPYHQRAPGLWRSEMTQEEIERHLTARESFRGELVRVESPLDLQVAEALSLPLDVVARLHDARSLSNDVIVSMPMKKLARALWRVSHPKPDHPGEAVAFRNEQWKDEHGRIPPNALLNAAMEHRNAVSTRPWRARWTGPPPSQSAPAPGSAEPPGSAELQGAPVAPMAGITSGGWQELGPGGIGGRVRSIIVHPATPTTMFLGSVSGGIWKTTNSGASWQVIDDFMSNLAVSTLVMDPTNSNVIYAGTGEGFYNGDGIRGAGVFKSVDGGTSWNRLASTNNSSWYYVNRLAMSPNGDTVVAATRSGIYTSSDDGVSWTQRLALEMLDVDWAPGNNLNAVAGGWYGRAYYTTNGGVTWTQAAGVPFNAGDFYRRVETAYSPSDANTVYASVNVNSGEVWRSTDGGQSYALQNTGTNYLGSQGWYDNALWVDPTGSDTVIVGGIDLYRSVNAGTSLSQMSQWWSAPASAHADHHYIVAHPSFDGNANKTVFFGNDGGIYRASNVYTAAGVSGWQELNNNLRITQFYGVSGSNQSGFVYGGTQDNGTLRFSGDTETWNTSFGGDGGFSASDPSDSRYHYGEYVYLQIHRSTNSGVSAGYIYAGIGDAGTSTANFIAPFILDPNAPDRMLAGGRSLWRSNNVKAGGPTWSAIKASNGINISAIAVAPGNSEVVWVGHNNGDVYVTTNGTQASPTWTKVDANGPLPDRMVLRIAVDPQISSRAYVAFAGFNNNNLWSTENNGAAWTDINTNAVTKLPTAPIRGFAVWSANTDSLYAGTEVGIYASEDRGVNWSPANEGPTNCSVDELKWVGNDTLLAATHGRGVFRIRVANSDNYVVPGKTWYVNDASRTGDSYCFAVGSNSNNGLTRSTPKLTIAAAISAASAGDTVLVDAGSYAEAPDISKDSLAIVGVGATTIVDPPGATTTTSVWGLRASNRANLSIRSLKVTGAYIGVRFSNVDRSLIDGVTSNSNRFGISLLSGSDSNAVRGCTLNSNSHIGVYLNASSRNTLNGNIARQNTNSGIFLISRSDTNTMNGNVTDTNKFGIYMYGSRANHMESNVSRGNSHIGLYSSSCAQTEMLHNSVHGNLNSGIFVIRDADDTVQWNEAIKNMSGIHTYASSRVLVESNTAILNTGIGLYINSMTASIVKRNRSTDNYAGLWLRSSTNNIVSRNTIDSNKVYQIGLDAASSSDTVTDNNILRTGTVPYVFSASTTGATFDFTNNWWGTAVAGAISAGITGSAANRVTFNPFAVALIDTWAGSIPPPPSEPGPLANPDGGPTDVGDGALTAVDLGPVDETLVPPTSLAPTARFSGADKVGLVDLLMLLPVIGKPASYDPGFDVNRIGPDGRIDAEDLFEVGRQFGH